MGYILLQMADRLPDDPEELKKMISSLLSNNQHLQDNNQYLQDSNQHLQDSNQLLEVQAKVLKERIELLEKHLYASKSEKWTVDDKIQMVLFDEAEALIVTQEESLGDSNSAAPGKQISHKGRRPIPSDIPRVERVHSLTEEERRCSCCGELRPIIGYEESEELEYIPAQIRVILHKKEKCGPCKKTETCINDDTSPILTAKAPSRMMPGSIASVSLLAFIITGKYCDALPFYRQERIFKRLGIDISRMNMCNWTIKTAAKCSALIELMKDKTREGPLINMDETTVQVLKEPGKKPDSKSYMWVTVGSDSGHKIILFNYSRTRSTQMARTLLDGFQGALQSDGYAGYNAVVKESGLWHVGCLAHIRRKFIDAAKVTKSGGQANIAIKYIKKLYAIEKEIAQKRESLSEQDILILRRKKAIPILKKFREWLSKKKTTVVPSMALGKAIHYADGEYKKVVRYLRYAYLTPDNNVAENAIRPFVVGRKNWMFNDTPRGAYASAGLYSLVETAKANGVEPQFYLKYIFEQIPEAGDNKEKLEKLLPWNIPHERLESEAL